MDAPKPEIRNLQYFEAVFAEVQAPEHAVVLDQTKALAQQAERVRALSEVAREIESPRIVTFATA